EALERPDNFVYERHFVAGLLARYAAKAALFPERYRSSGFGPIRTVREFDDLITAPQFGYRDAEEYYRLASAKAVVDRIRVPTLVLPAEDDPFVPVASIRATGVERNPRVRFLAPAHGGHCGFISKARGPGRFWAESRIVEFCAAVAA